MPSTATEPLAAMKRASSAGASKTKRTLPPSGVIETIFADAVDMAGDQVAAQLVAELERPFEVDPLARPASRRDVVLSSVSPEASTANQSAPFSTTVRQQPEQAIEAPIAIGVMSCLVRTTKRRSPACPPGVTAVISPTSVTIPVNMRRYLCRSMPGFQHVAAERSGAQTRVNRGAKSSFCNAERPDRRAAVRRPAAAAAGTRSTRSTRSACRNAAATSPPPSTSTRVRPRVAERLRGRAATSTRPCVSDATSITSTPRRLQAPRARWPAPSRAEQPDRRLAGRRDKLRAGRQCAPCESSTTRTGDAARGRAAGRSARDRRPRPCSTPTMIASCVARRRWPSARAAAPVIHLLSPDARGDPAVERGRELQM